MSFMLSAGVYPFEYVRGTSPFNPVNMTIGCSTFASRKGPLGPTLITGGYDEFTKRYGSGDMQWSPAHLALKPALKEMRVFYGNRVVNGALYAGLTLYYDETNSNFFSVPFSTGATQGYQDGARDSALVTFSNEIPKDGTITFDLGSKALTQPFNTTSNYTLALLATQIQNELDSLGDGGTCQVVKAWELSDRKEEITINFSREFIAGDKLVAKITGHLDSEISIDASFTDSSEAMVQAIVEQINTNSQVAAAILPTDLPSIRVACLNAGPANLTFTKDSTSTGDFTVEALTIKQGHGVYDDRTILITFPSSTEAPELAGTVESATASVTVDVSESSKVLDIFAENPGAWASDNSEGLGIKISNLDHGIQQRNRLTLSQAVAAGNEFSCSIGYQANSWDVGPVAFNESSDQTLKDIAAAIQKILDENVGEGGQAYVEEVTGGTENDRNILIITPKAGQEISINDPLFVGGASQPIVIAKEVIPTTPSTETFNLDLYNRRSLTTAIESWQVTLGEQTDANGQQMNIESRINKGAYVSENIRVVAYTKDFSKISEIEKIAWLGGGDDGYLPTINQITAGWDEFADPEKITVRILINGGYGNVNVHQKMASIAQKRRDCVALLDMPADSQSTTGAMNYRQYEMNVNTSYAALYSPDVLVFDEVSGTDQYIGPSGFAAAQICYTERTRAIYWAPAGLNRGKCDGGKGVRVNYGEGDRDLLEPLQINPILDKKTQGVVIMGEYTTQTANDPLRDLHVRLLCNNIEIAMTDAMQYKLFEPNDDYLRTVMAKEVDDYLKPIKDGRGISDYRVVSDIDRENAADVDLGVAVVNYYIKPISSTKYIRLNSFILGSGVSFEEVIVNGV